MGMSVLNIIKSFCYETNIPAPTTLVSSPTAGTQQLIYLFYAVCRELRQEKYWIQLKKSHSFNTVASTSDYNLPSDFYSSLYETGWNSTTRLPLVGPLDDSFANYELYGMVNYGSQTQYRIFGLPGSGQFKVMPTPTSVQTIKFDYISKDFIGTGAAPYTWSEAITLDADICAFDDDLLILGLKWKWYQMKGLDYQSLKDEYTSKIEQAVNRFKGSYAGSLTRYYAEYGLNSRYRPQLGGWSF